MTAARSDFMALAAKLDNHCRPLAHDWLAYQLTNEERDLIVSALRLAASQPDREAIARATDALKPFAEFAYFWRDIPGVVKTHSNVELWQKPGAVERSGLNIGHLRAAAEALSLLSGAGTKSDGGEERPASNPSSRVTHGPSDPSPGPDVRRRVLDILNVVAPAVENLARHQGQCDMDGVMVKVSRQALDEVLNAVNEVALVSALTRPLGGFVQGSIARKQSSHPEGSSRTETAGGDA